MPNEQQHYIAGKYFCCVTRAPERKQTHTCHDKSAKLRSSTIKRWLNLYMLKFIFVRLVVSQRLILANLQIMSFFIGNDSFLYVCVLVVDGMPNWFVWMHLNVGTTV